ncbi:amidohydrolase [Pelosinus sp. sgz500959]|uniref:amidohydrolase n=1 Tax=Pelosinus sp. sgz500959 TaxID=3242472 RepID=UPI003671688E
MSILSRPFQSGNQIHEFADRVLTNGIVYTADENDQICEALAIKENKIIFVGSNREVQQYIGKDTKEIDLFGKMVIPGMIDSHIHPPGLSLLTLHEVQLFNMNSVEGYVEAVKDFILQHPDMKAVYGRGWSWGILTGDELNKGPRKEHLDAVSKDIPIVLRANDGHTLWVNSKALEVNGITSETQVPQGGIIEKNLETGELWGTLKEWAMWLIALPEYSLDQYMTAMDAFQKKMHSFGITSILCMASLPFEKIMKACSEMEKEQQLALRIRGAMTIHTKDDFETQLEMINQMRSRYHSSYLKVISAKFFTDGVIEGGTSCLLEPYTIATGRGANYYGEFLWDMEELKQAFCRVNECGLSIHVHSTGDASTQHVLNALEAVHRKGLTDDHRNTITHLQLVDEKDILRFKELNVIASVQPYWQFKGPQWWHTVDSKFLGERAEKEFPLGTFFANGITVASSSDYPATAVPNPLLAIDVGVTRNIDNGVLHGVEDISHMDDERYLLNKQERASVSQMIKSFTINGAFMMFMENEIGSIEIGKLADLVVLDQNLFTINPVDIDKVKVVMTFFDGKLVYET